jgi:glycosyltransferase involved in cell wall biosynthesis
MSIVIFGDLFSFPDGGAATNRVHYYARGFKENGINVSVICFLSRYSDNEDGIIDGIRYYYPFQEKTRSRYFFIRFRKKLKKYFTTWKLCRSLNREDKIIAINSWTNLLSVHLFAWLLCKLVEAKLVTEGSEHPLRFYQGSWIRRWQGGVKLYIESRLCDGILCISRYLVEFYKKEGVNPKKLLLVPSTVDPSVFSGAFRKPIPEKYIGYFGSLSFKRDNVDMLIHAFADFNVNYPDVRLVLGGFCTQDMKDQMLALINKLNIQSKVRMLDFLSRKEILEYITNAEVLVMTRSKDLESAASYPSKLTEFLATGAPVISVNVGEVSDFLKDNENAFLVEPGDTKELVNKLDFVYKNYEFARQVGKKGKELTEGIFNYNFQAKRVIGFIDSLR